jgi:hypothetical protein
VVEGARPAPLRAVVLAIAAASLVMLLLGAKPLLDWANGLPISEASDEILGWAQEWHDLAEATGLDQPFKRLQYLFRLLEALRF